MRRTVIGLFLAAAALPVAAQPRWPEHGFFRVIEEQARYHRRCSLRAEASVRGEPFAFHLGWRPAGPLEVLVMAGEVLRVGGHPRIAVKGTGDMHQNFG